MRSSASTGSLGRPQAPGSSASTDSLVARSMAKSSPYARSLGRSASTASLGGRSSASGWLQPPAGAFNEPDPPEHFQVPGPGRYTPTVDLTGQPTRLSTKLSSKVCRFGSEDRMKYLSPELPLELTSTGMVGISAPKAVGPGPCYKPTVDYKSKSRPREVTFSTSDPNPPASRHHVPGPQVYTPSDTVLSTTALRGTRHHAGGRFLGDDRLQYLGQIDPASLRPIKAMGPGPGNPNVSATLRRASTISFGKRGPGKALKPPSLAAGGPGPGAYELPGMAQAACLSSKRRAPATSFAASRSSRLGKMETEFSPGPRYNPSYKSILRSASQPTFGRDRRFGRA